MYGNRASGLSNCTTLAELKAMLTHTYFTAFDENMDDVNDALQQLTMRQQERNYYTSNVPRVAAKSTERQKAGE